MNFNNLYRPRNRIRPKRTREEKRNMGRILLAGLAAALVGVLVMALILIFM